MCSTQSMKPNIKQELVETDYDVIEILPRRAVAPNGSGFSVKIRDTSELTIADIELIKPFLKLPAIVPTAAARFSMKEVSGTGGWEINVEDTSTLTFTHMHSIVGVIASRERELRSGQQHPQVPPQQQSPAGTRVQLQQHQPPRQHQNPAANANPRQPVNLADIFAARPAFVAAKKRGRKPKDPNAPKRPLGPYFLWLNANRHQFTQPGMRVTDVTKAAGIAWAAMSNEEKEHWQERASEDKQRYDREMADYLRGMRDQA
ncbi:high mobility group protein [Aphelenchoides avenae]|nr:high mobility group protein [Aphelenchus avenae]